MKHVLIIDDEARIRNMYKGVLEEEGFAVLEAENASKATFKMIAADTVDLVLLDLNMPEVDGRVMREVIQEYDPCFKVIVSSVYPVADQQVAVPDAVDYFDKAQGIGVLLDKVRNALS